MRQYGMLTEAVDVGDSGSWVASLVLGTVLSALIAPLQATLEWRLHALLDSHDAFVSSYRQGEPAFTHEGFITSEA